MELFYLWFIIPPIILSFIFFIMLDTWEEVNLFTHLIMSIIVGGFVGGVTLLFTTGIVRANWEKHEMVYESHELVSLDSHENINGNFSNLFFVGSGHIGEDLYYHFFYDTSNGVRYQKEYAESSNFYLKETNGKPYYKKYALFWDNKHKNSHFYNRYSIRYTKEVLEIPKGSIKRHYKVN